MSETREQFRERIGKVAYETHSHEYEEESLFGDILKTVRVPWERLPEYLKYINESVGDVEEITTVQQWQDAAEAVYAQALRDVLSGEGDYFDKDQVSSRRLVYDYLMWFAAERGIEVGGEQ